MYIHRKRDVIVIVITNGSGRMLIIIVVDFVFACIKTSSSWFYSDAFLSWNLMKLLWVMLNASVTTRRTCYGSCVPGAAAELRLKFCVCCGWLGSESDSAATVLAMHISCGRRASDTLNCMQKIPQWRHVQRTGAVPSRYLQRVFAVPPATCPYGGVRVCTSVARRRCVEGIIHVRPTPGHVLPAQSIYSELITGIPAIFIFNLTLLNTVKIHQLKWHGTPGDWDCSGCIWWQRDSAETTLSWPWLLGKDNGFKKKQGCDSIGCDHG